MTVKRAFADIAEGQIHYRVAGLDREALPPLVMFHGSPGSSWALAGLVEALGETRTTVAFDTLGQGDSCAPARDDADMAYFAGAAARALARPYRVRRLSNSGVSGELRYLGSPSPMVRAPNAITRPRGSEIGKITRSRKKS